MVFLPSPYGLAVALLASAASSDVTPSSVTPSSVAPSSVAPSAEPPTVLVSRQLLESERLALGQVISLSSEPSGAGARSFRIAGVYEPTPDPQRLGSSWREVRLHLPDLIALTRDPAGADAQESVGAINIRLKASGDDEAFSRALAARLPGLTVRPTRRRPEAGDPFVVLDRFHLAIALVTVIASSIFLLALMVMLVDERRQMVAVLRLIGLRRRRILLQVLVEGLVIAMAGAAFGVLVAMAAQGGINRFFQWRYDTALVFVHVTAPIVLRSLLLAVPLGVLASLASAWGLLRREVLAVARR